MENIQSLQPLVKTHLSLGEQPKTELHVNGFNQSPEWNPTEKLW